MISKNVHYKYMDIMFPIYTSLVRAHLELAIQYRLPHLRGDIDKMERIQRPATKMISELRATTYSHTHID